MAADRFRRFLSAERVRRHQDSGEWPRPGLAEVAARQLEVCPEREILIDGPVRLTVGDFVGRAQALAGGLRQLGLGPGDIITWEIPSWWEAAVLATAIDWIGAVNNPIIPIYREREVSFIARQAESRALFVPGEFRGFDYRAMAEKVRGECEQLGHVVVVRGDPGDGMSRFADLLDADPITRPYRRSPEEVSMLFYTSGTTADPKGVMHTSSTIGWYCVASMNAMQTSRDDVGLLQFPLTHIGGLVSFVLLPLMAASRVVYLDTWTAESAIDLIEKEHVTSAGGPPVILQGLMASSSLTPARVASLRTAGTGAAGIPPELVRKVGERLGATSFRAYGLTECPMVTTGVPDDPEDKRCATDGRPSPGCVLRTVGSDGAEVGQGVEGEIQVFAPQLCVGYVDESLNDAAFTADGFLRTGDLGVIDEVGYLRVTGRLKDIIIRKGENLSAQAIENELHAHPDIDDVAVFGLPDGVAGERACAAVVLRDGSENITLAALRGHMEGRGVMRQMIPEQLEIVDALPRNATGKVLKFELRKRFA